MRIRLLPIAVVVMTLAVLAAVPAEARNRGRRFDDRRARVVVVDRSPRVIEVDRFDDRRGRVVLFDRSPRVIFDDRRDRFDDRPYGWSRGRKVGWGNCDLPPGLAKKYGCSNNRSTIILRERPVYRRPLFYFGF